MRTLQPHEQQEWVQEHGLVYPRVRLFMSSTRHLLERVNACLCTSRKHQHLSFDSLAAPPSKHKQNMLRLALAWNCEGNVLLAKPPKGFKSKDELFTVPIVTPSLSEPLVHELFGEGVEWKLDASSRTIYDAAYTDVERSLVRQSEHSELYPSVTPVRYPPRLLYSPRPLCHFSVPFLSLTYFCAWS